MPDPSVVPYLLYEDATAALDWLTRVFGLEETLRLTDAEGAVNHAELAVGSGSNQGQILLGAPGGDYQSPGHTGHVHSHISVYVDDVDAHYAHARDAGANITEEPADQFYGDRRYGVTDLEGHLWWFATHLREVSTEDMQAVTSEQ
jgi:uncharacterized glyoxalase superfamily protein PhnB